jgi:hypothetical protein
MSNGTIIHIQKNILIRNGVFIFVGCIFVIGYQVDIQQLLT